MRIKGVLLGTYDEQVAGEDRYPVQPRLVSFEDQEVRVSIAFDSASIIGHTTKIWREDGRVMFEAEIDESKLTRTDDEQYEQSLAAIGIRLEQYREDGTLLRGGKIFEVGLTNENENRNQPGWEVTDG